MHVSDKQMRALPGSASFSGGLWNPDLGIFRFLLEDTGTRVPGGGDLAEIGAAWGHTSVLIGSYLQAGETFTVVDLWEKGATDAENARENAQSYTGLTKAKFLSNYLSVLPEPPTVIQDFSSAITGVASHRSHRFIHVDASHLYEHVRQDVESSRVLVKPGGVVVFDDYRAEHCPGVAAAVWEAVTQDGLRPFMVTPFKLYATWDDSIDWREVMRGWLPTFGCGIDPHYVGEHEILRVKVPSAWGKHPAKQFLPPAAIPALKAVRNRAKAALHHARNRG
ncbi:class I SAM-dependent methyltransferase [Flexivirga sp. B27]